MQCKIVRIYYNSKQQTEIGCNVLHYLLLCFYKWNVGAAKIMSITTEVYESGNKPGVKDSSNTGFELKGSLLTVIELKLFDPLLTDFSIKLHQKISQAPDFFKRAPVAIDLSMVKDSNKPIGFSGIISVLKQNNLIPIGVRNGSNEQHNQAEAQGLSILNSPSSDAKAKRSQDSVSADADLKSKQQQAYSKTVVQPIRSGQQIYAKDCDLVVLTTVSAGADVISDGHIHVYGALRGRALAGVNGNESARIFCSKLDAQLVAIAGYYRVIEELDQGLLNRPVQIFLKNRHLMIEAL